MATLNRRRQRLAALGIYFVIVKVQRPSATRGLIGGVEIQHHNREALADGCPRGIQAREPLRSRSINLSLSRERGDEALEKLLLSPVTGRSCATKCCFSSARDMSFSGVSSMARSIPPAAVVGERRPVWGLASCQLPCCAARLLASPASCNFNNLAAVTGVEMAASVPADAPKTLQK
jgi:hypothetical protein